MSNASQPVPAERPPSLMARIVGYLFFGVFLAVGLAFFIGFIGLPLLHIAAARGWRSESCEIVSSTVVTGHDSEGATSYELVIAYRYYVDDRAYVGHRYQFSRGLSNSYRGKSAIVARLRPGTRTACWVDPENPAEAVIDRGLTADLWIGLVPLVFIVIGAGGIYSVARWRGPGGLTSDRATKQGPAFTKSVSGARPSALRPRTGRLAKLAGMTVVMLFWNGILSVFLYQLLTPSSRSFQWFLLIFLVPFVLVGILLIALVIGQALRLSNPRPNVTVNKAIVALGDELRVDWTLDGRVARLARFSITLEGREEATYSRGTDKVTDTNVFETMELANQIPPGIARAGSARVKIPADTMHSFTAAHNKVVWALRVRGDVPNWPDSEDEFPVTVAPRDR